MQHLRADDGGYWTGYVFADEAVWPVEQTTYTAAAVVLAVDALSVTTPGSDIFRGSTLPPDLPEIGLECGCAEQLATASDRVAGVAVDAGQHPHRAEHLGLLEAAAERPQVDPVRRLPAVRGVGEHVVDDQRAAARTQRPKPV